MDFCISRFAIVALSFCEYLLNATNCHRYKVFARALLEGDVFPALRSVVPHLVAKPALMQRAWAQERILVFVAALADNNVCWLPASIFYQTFE
jgi:hypothetical protein